MRLKRTLSVILTALVLFSVLVIPVSAKQVEFVPYSGYEYNADSESVAAPVTYTYNRSITSDQLGIGTIETVEDILYYNNVLYLLDSGNGRIIELTKDLSLKNVRDDFKDNEGKSISFAGAKGFTISPEGLIYVSDTVNERILVFNNENVLVQKIEKPNTDIVGYDFNFDVTKIMINKQGVIYVLVNSLNDGAFAFSAEGEFLQFFGRNTTVVTADVILNFFRRKFMTREQLSKVQNYTPTSIANFDMDDKGFIYTISLRDSSTKKASSVKKLSFDGLDIFESSGIITEFGDLEWDRAVVNSQYTSFNDVEVDSLGFVHLLDVGRGRVFEYSHNGQLIGVFGGYGTQLGMFSDPISIETIDDKVYVLEKNGSIIEFVPTEYIKYLREAFLDLDTSNPQQAIDAWNKVLKLNSNSQYPYYGLGMAYEKLGDYKTAMENFKLASAKSEYSNAFEEYRKQFLRDNLILLLLAVVAFIAIIVFAAMYISKKVKSASTAAYSVLERKYTFPLYTLFHPTDGFEQFKYRPELPSYKVCIGIITAFFFIGVFSYFGTGYCFNDSSAADYSIFSTLLSTVVIYVLYVVGNWAVCSLFDGNGKIKEIAAVTAYGLIPYICSQLICTILSNVLSIDEGIALTIITVIGVLWSAMIILLGLAAVNQYYIGKTIFTVILTIFAMLVLALIGILFFSLIQQVIYFVKSIWDEAQLR